MFMIGADLDTPIADLEGGKGFSLGDRFVDHEGKEYVFVQADGAINANDVVIISEAYQADQLDTTNSAAALGGSCRRGAGHFRG